MGAGEGVPADEVKRLSAPKSRPEMMTRALCPLLASVLGGCAAPHGERLLAVGGVHALDGAAPCQLSNVEPGSALEDQHWKEALVVRAVAEGTAEVACGEKRTKVLVVKPDRLELRRVEDRVVVGQRFHVRVVPRDKADRELEVGKWTQFTWHTEPPITTYTDPSAGEFGFGEGTFGVVGFRAAEPTIGRIEARLGEAMGTLRVDVQR